MTKKMNDKLELEFLNLCKAAMVHVGKMRRPLMDVRHRCGKELGPFDHIITRMYDDVCASSCELLLAYVRHHTVSDPSPHIGVSSYLVPRNEVAAGRSAAEAIDCARQFFEECDVREAGDLYQEVIFGIVARELRGSASSL
jgi:hypothetical protein